MYIIFIVLKICTIFEVVKLTSKFEKLAKQEDIIKAKESLEESGIRVIVVEDKNEAKEKILSQIPKDSEVMNMTSVTLTEIGIEDEILNSGKYKPVRKELERLGGVGVTKKMRALGASAEITLGSVQAITTDGKILIASNTGSQLPAHAYASPKVILVAGTNKIVKDFDEGMERIHEHSLPLESERARKAYGVSGSHVSKLLMIDKEVKLGRITLFLVKEKLGY
ncbi:hypothetical protein GF327_07430 [Candidatus Woesearchaeota archaeon]|nr:hypothetical protein [Candidatus Woesearchaeota archaeon]